MPKREAIPTVLEPKSERPVSDAGMCFAFDPGSTVTIGQRKSPAEEAVSRKPVQPSAPLTKAEIGQMLEILKPVRIEGDKGFRISGEGGKISSERMQVLVRDVTAILTRIHLGEMLHRMSNLPNPDKRTLDWGGDLIKAIDLCGLDRYRGFDIEPQILLDDVTSIVTGFRSELESVLLENLAPIDLPIGDKRLVGRGNPP